MNAKKLIRIIKIIETTSNLYNAFESNKEKKENYISWKSECIYFIENNFGKNSNFYNDFHKYSSKYEFDSVKNGLELLLVIKKEIIEEIKYPKKIKAQEKDSVWEKGFLKIIDYKTRKKSIYGSLALIFGTLFSFIGCKIMFFGINIISGDLKVELSRSNNLIEIILLCLSFLSMLYFIGLYKKESNNNNDINNNKDKIIHIKK